MRLKLLPNITPAGFQTRQSVHMIRLMEACYESVKQQGRKQINKGEGFKPQAQ